MKRLLYQTKCDGWAPFLPREGGGMSHSLSTSYVPAPVLCNL